jgi:succinate dehydrogenase / fumarate reductase flavoprotein subunit
MHKHGWILKTEEGLREGLEEVMQLRGQKVAVASDNRVLNSEWVEALEISNMLLLAELVLRASLMRKESRGSFYRLDYPRIDDRNWKAHVVFRKTAEEVNTTVEKVA